jgi:rare lipoprotein A
MRLPNNAFCRVLALGLTASLAGCGMLGGGNDRPVAASSEATTKFAQVANGPAADYPMVLGEPFTVDGELYTPSDTMSYDAVGYATLDAEGANGITGAHKTLPLPSYVEVTSLDTGRTILVRIERRGPMTGSREIALSAAAQAQLGSTDGTPVRVRRVNPVEAERAELRAGNAAPLRMDTPMTLVTVLRRKLPADGSASLRSAAAEQARVESLAASSGASLASVSAGPAKVAIASEPGTEQGPASIAKAFDKAFGNMPNSSSAKPAEPVTVRSYPLPPIDGTPPSIDNRTSAQSAKALAASTSGDGFVVQAAAFSSKANANRAAGKLDGFVMKSGKYYRVRTGPYTTRGQAEAALAKVRAAGYSDARVYTSG